MFQHYEQVHHDRLATANLDQSRRRVLAQHRAQKRLERAERQARQARLVLATFTDARSGLGAAPPIISSRA